MNLDLSRDPQEVEHKKSSAETPLVEVTKIYNANVEDVYKAWSDEGIVLNWWGPKNYSCPFAKINFKVGGKYLFAMKKNDEDQVLWSTGTYVQIVPNKKIICSDQPSDKFGNVITPQEAGFKGVWPDNGLAYITVEFEALSDTQTRLQLSHENLPAHMHDECVDGWSSSLDKIKPLVEKH